MIPARQEKLAEVFTRKEILTVPNLLSLIRLGLAILFPWNLRETWYERKQTGSDHDHPGSGSDRLPGWKNCEIL